MLAKPPIRDYLYDSMKASEAKPRWIKPVLRPVPIFFDLGGLQKANANLDDRTTLDVKDASFGTALKMVLDQVGLTYQVEDGRVVIGAPTADHTAPAKN